MATKPFKNYIEDARPKEGYVLQTDIVDRILKATKAKKKEDQILLYVAISPEMATDILTLNISNRNPTYADIERYAYDMVNDKWWFVGNVMKVDTNGHLIDGQKELWAIRYSGTTQIYHIQCGLNPECKSAIDTGRNRSLADALVAAGFNDVNNKASAIRSIISIKKYGRVPALLERGMKVDNQSVLNWTKGKGNIDLLEKSVNKGREWRKQVKIFTVSNFAVLDFLLHRINAEECEFFMSKLVDPIDLNTRNVRDFNINLCRQKLTYMDSGNAARFTRSYKDERFRYVIRAWNASRDGVKLEKLNEKFVDLESPNMEKLH